MSGFDARVLASAQQIGESLGLTIAAVLEKPARAAQVREALGAMQRSLATTAPPPIEAQPEHATISANDVARAISAGRMELHLQPIVSAAGHVVTSAEALIRWRDPSLGLVLPDRFIPAAEADTDVIDRLTMWVAESGVAHYRRLAELGSEIQICINISGRNLQSLDFPDRMAGVLERMSAPPGAIGLEITETVATHDLDATTAILTRLRLKGFPVAIDDFGTGHSSLAALRRMPFSVIKIDKSFVGELETSSEFADDRAFSYSACTRHGSDERGRGRGKRRDGTGVDRAGHRQPAGFLFQPATAVRRVCGVAAHMVAQSRRSRPALDRVSHTVCKIISRFISGASSARQSALPGSTDSCARSV